MTYMTTIVRPGDLAGFRRSVRRSGGHIVQSAPCGGGFAVTIANPVKRERVHESGHDETLPVTRITTTHHGRDGITWPELLALVTMWRNRYPGQTFYVVSWREAS